jgi:hypothetical protein
MRRLTMPNTYDFLGDFNNYFMKSSLQVFTDASGAIQYVGKTQNEKNISPEIELAEWYDNSSGTQTLFVLDIDRFGYSIGFSFMQVLDPNVFAMAWNGDLDTSDPNRVFTFYGSAPNALGEYEWRFVGQGRSGLAMTLVIRKGIMVPDGDWTVGTPGDYTQLPVRVRALQDTSISNTLRDMAYVIVDKRTFS